MELVKEQWTQAEYDAFLGDLRAQADEPYRAFTERLTPGIKGAIGIRIPALRSMAKEIAKGNGPSFIRRAQDGGYEELMLAGMVICRRKGAWADIAPLANAYLDRADNWALIDVFCTGLKVVKKEPEQAYPDVVAWLHSGQPWKIRAALVLFLSYYIMPEYLDRILQHAGTVTKEHYYVQMANAWLISVCLAKFPDRTLPFLENCPLDNFTYNKALQKALESYRVSPALKDQIRAMKRK